jgi:hypothetical protein
VEPDDRGTLLRPRSRRDERQIRGNGGTGAHGGPSGRCTLTDVQTPTPLLRSPDHPARPVDHGVPPKGIGTGAETDVDVDADEDVDVDRERDIDTGSDVDEEVDLAGTSASRRVR